MLKLTRRSDYGLIALRHLASQHVGTACSAKEIAATYGLPVEMLAKILQKLTKQGLLVSQYGTNGGYALARDPSLISAFEVIRAIEGPVFITSCSTERGACDQSSRCVVREPLRQVNESIVRALSAVSISSLNEDRPGLIQMEGVV
jgi:FeS assembly SUF system regulator